MKKSPGIPRILKIASVDGWVVTLVFNNGEYRQLDFQSLFQRWNYEQDPFRSRLLDPALFATLTLRAGTLCWPELTLQMTLSNGLAFEAPFELDPVVMYEESRFFFTSEGVIEGFCMLSLREVFERRLIS